LRPGARWQRRLFDNGQRHACIGRDGTAREREAQRGRLKYPFHDIYPSKLPSKLRAHPGGTNARGKSAGWMPMKTPDERHGRKIPL
jgi:hypothetical protein